MQSRRGSVRALLALCAWAACLISGPGLAQSSEPFPAKPVRILIPTAPGGNLDILARVVAEKLGAAWGQQVIVESRAGANTVLATTAVAKSPTDGYTALFTISGFVQNLVLRTDTPYKATTSAKLLAGRVALAAMAMGNEATSETGAKSVAL